MVVSYEVDPERLAHGTWSREFNKRVGEGDITAAYSGDLIALKGRVRRPFVFEGQLWVCIGLSNHAAKAYRLTPIDEAQFNNQADAKDLNAESARDDPDGFYHGVTVRYGPDWFVITGPPAEFVPGTPAQPGLFAD